MGEAKRREALREFEGLPETQCVNCGRTLDCALGEDDPRPGDVTLCIVCGHVQAFGEGLRMRALTAAEVIELAGDEQLLRYSNVLAEAKTEYERTTGKKWGEPK